MAVKSRVYDVKFSDGYELIYRPVAGAMTIFLPNPCERAINGLTRSDLENILEVVKELCEREQHKLRKNIQLEYIAAFSRWLANEPPYWALLRRKRWKAARPVCRHLKEQEAEE